MSAVENKDLGLAAGAAPLVHAADAKPATPVFVLSAATEALIEERNALIAKARREWASDNEILALLTEAVVAHGPLGDDSRPLWWAKANAAISSRRSEV